MITHRQFSTVGRLCLGLLHEIGTKPEHQVLMGLKDWDKLVDESDYWRNQKGGEIEVTKTGFIIFGVPVLPVEMNGIEIVMVIRKEN